MSGTGAGVTSGHLDLMAGHSQRLQEFSDTTASLMQQLSNHIAAAAPGFQGAAGQALSQAHERLNHAIMQHSTAFADQSHKMTNNSVYLQDQENQNAHIIGQVGNLL